MLMGMTYKISYDSSRDVHSAIRRAKMVSEAMLVNAIASLIARGFVIYEVRQA